MRLILIFGLICGLMSVCTYGVYALDKNAARRGRPRIPERSLHLLALLGGWPGALIAQQTLRHKTRKTSFQIIFWLTVLLNLAGLLLVAVCTLPA